MFEFVRRFFPEQDSGNDPELTVASGRSGKIGRPNNATRYRAASARSVGKVRHHNEDALFTLTASMAGVNQGVSLGLFLVADGMGGHQSGEVASRLAAQGVSGYVVENLFEPVLFDQEAVEADVVERLLAEAVEVAQSLIQNQTPGGGTTLTLLLALGDRLFSAHVGDSRLYRVGRDGQLSLLTRDHSLVKRLVDLGEITEAEAETHPQRNVLYRALGQSDSLEADLAHFEIQFGERLLICSDGLWSAVSNQQIQAILARESDLDQAAKNLVSAANEAGGPDNIAVVLIQKCPS